VFSAVSRSRKMGNALVKAALTDMTLQWVCFAVAIYFKTEKFYDLVGSSTYLILIMQSMISAGRFFPRQVRLYGITLQ